MMQDKSKVDSITQHRAQNQGSMGKKCIILYLLLEQPQLFTYGYVRAQG